MSETIRLIRDTMIERLRIRANIKTQELKIIEQELNKIIDYPKKVKEAIEEKKRDNDEDLKYKCITKAEHLRMRIYFNQICMKLNLGETMNMTIITVTIRDGIVVDNDRFDVTDITDWQIFARCCNRLRERQLKRFQKKVKSDD
jgi:hypothetical protein